VLVTTPESLFILLTAERPGDMLRTTRTVIVDDALVAAAGGPKPQRIGPAKAFKSRPIAFSAARTWTRTTEIATIAGRCV
jgi:hypothetical protein